MYFIYNFFTKIFLLISPIIFIYRIFKQKEDPKRFLEKYCIYKKNKNNKPNQVWIHAASVGELISIIPIIKKLEKINKIKKILLTTTTVSSANLLKNYKFKKTSHMYFPLDTKNIVRKFIYYWKPQLAIFVDSEIWPNMFANLNKNNIPIILINARITKKSFNRWKFFKTFAKKIFSKITLALASNSETYKYLKILGSKNIINAGNLKFYSDEKIKNKSKISNKFKNYKVWCAASTHKGEEKIICEIHNKLKKINKKLITIIIPRHVFRTREIINEFKENGINCIRHSSKQSIKKNTDVYLVDVYGKTSEFYKLSNVTFLGGSIIKHGGQNPLEPARLGNYIISGPNISNFREIYTFLINNKVSSISSNALRIEKLINKNLNKKISSRLTKKINDIGIKILNKNLINIQKYIT